MTYFSGPFLMALFSKLDGMMQNSLPVNLLLTGVIARLASYPQPLLRSFLLSHNLVFQPTVKSLLQVQNGLYMNVDSLYLCNCTACVLWQHRGQASRNRFGPCARQAEETVTLHLSSSHKIYTLHVYMNFIIWYAISSKF